MVAGSARPASLGTASSSHRLSKAAKSHSGSRSLTPDPDRVLARLPRPPRARHSDPPPPPTCAGRRSCGPQDRAAGSAETRRAEIGLAPPAAHPPAARLPLAPRAHWPLRRRSPVQGLFPHPHFRRARWAGRPGDCGRKWWNWEGGAAALRLGHREVVLPGDRGP